MEESKRARKNLVKAGQYSRVVEYNDDIEGAIRRVFSDVSRVANAPALLLQRKDEEWGEMWHLQ